MNCTCRSCLISGSIIPLSPSTEGCRCQAARPEARSQQQRQQQPSHPASRAPGGRCPGAPWHAPCTTRLIAPTAPTALTCPPPPPSSWPSLLPPPPASEPFYTQRPRLQACTMPAQGRGRHARLWSAIKTGGRSVALAGRTCEAGVQGFKASWLPNLDPDPAE